MISFVRWVHSFNDFFQVVDASKPWKSPSCLFYLCKEDLDANKFKTPERQHNLSCPQFECAPAPTNPCPIPRSVMLKDVNLSRHPSAPRIPDPLFTPLSEKEAIDIEEKGEGCLGMHNSTSFQVDFCRWIQNMSWWKRVKILDRIRFPSQGMFPIPLSWSLIIIYLRLSVVRAEAPMEGVPCLDCYILTHQAPKDYLTQCAVASLS